MVNSQKGEAFCNGKKSNAAQMFKMYIYSRGFLDFEFPLVYIEY